MTKLKLRQNFIGDKIGVIVMTDKVGKPRSKSKTVWFSTTLIASGIVLTIAFLTSPAFSVFIETNVPDAWLAVAVAVVGVAVRWLREATTEPLAK